MKKMIGFKNSVIFVIKKFLRQICIPIILNLIIN